MRKKYSWEAQTDSYEHVVAVRQQDVRNTNVSPQNLTDVKKGASCFRVFYSFGVSGFATDALPKHPIPASIFPLALATVTDLDLYV